MSAFSACGLLPATPCACWAAVRAFVTSSKVPLLVRGVALDRLDEVRDQVVAAAELDVDLGPRVLRAVPQPDEPVVDEDEEEEQRRDDHDDDHQPDHGPTLTRRAVGSSAR